MTENIIPEHLEIGLEKGSKMVYIKDDKDFIRFIVSFITIEEKEAWDNNRYLVKVQEVLPKNDEIFEISRQFFKEEDKIQSKEHFEKMIRDYQIIVRMPKEIVDPQKIFNDTVNYRRIDPECCGNCVFCVIHEDWCEREQKYQDKKLRFFCSCKKNLRTNEYAREILGKYSKKSQITNIQDMIEVEPDHICDNHSRIKDNT